MNRRLVPIAAAFLFACACESETPAQTVSMPDDATVLTGEQAGAVLSQCSRAAPQSPERFWNPSAGKIVALEQRLPAAVAAAARLTGWSEAAGLSRWRRQYVGLETNRRQTVYVNLVPVRSAASDWRTAAMVVCDGGPDFFGAEYDVETGRIVAVDFNGPLDPPR